MHERLLEGWLDSAGERTYQGPFCQVLSAEGFTVLHSTRHAPIEFGKDVIARAPDGVLCAYQLKGNPGGRLTLAQFREIQPQLWQLATQAIVIPGVQAESHRSFLVTNGSVDEEVHRSIDDMNRKLGSNGSPIEVMARGQLLALFGKHATEFWPTEIPELHRLFRLLAARGDGQPPFDLLHELLLPILLLDREPAEPSAADIRRRITSAALVVAVSMRSFSARANHFSVIAAWVLYATYITAACERYGQDATRVAAGPVGIARDTILQSLFDLAHEAAERKHHVEGNPLVDASVYRARRTLVVGLLATLWLWCERSQGWPSPGLKESVEGTIKSARAEMELWGEGAISQYLALHWYARATSATPEPDGLLAALLRATVTVRKEGPNEATLASPYYSFEDVRRHQLGMLTGGPDPFEDDTVRVSTSFAEPLFHLLVRTGLKQTCKGLWPDMTKVPHVSFEPEKPWGFCLWRTEQGKNVTRILPNERQWSTVVEHARCIGTPEVPTFLREQPDVLLLFVLLCPHRATPNVVRYLGRVFNESWFIEPAVLATPPG